MHIRLWGLTLPLLAGLLCGCNHLNALGGYPDLDAKLLIPDPASKLLVPPPPGGLGSLPPDCNVAVDWERTAVVDASGNLVGSWGRTTNQPVEAYKFHRDKCIYVYIDAIDVAYMKFKSDTLALVGDANAGADITILGLTGAATGVGSREAKTILAGIATFIGGVRDKITADVLYNTSIITLLQRMDADRNEVHAAILQQMQKGPAIADSGNTQPAKAAGPVVKSGIVDKHLVVAVPASATVPASTTTIDSYRNIAPTPANPRKTAELPYSLDQAASDLLAYYAAGTYAHAVVSMQEHTGAQATNCKAAVKNIKTTGTKAGNTTELDTPTDGTKPQTSDAQPNAC
jgi:hypothetical protein